MAERGRVPEGGWFGEPRRHSEAAQKGRQRETHAPVNSRTRPKEIGGIRAPLAVPPDAEMAFVGSKEEMLEESKKVPANQEKMTTPMYGMYVLWVRERK